MKAKVKEKQKGWKEMYSFDETCYLCIWFEDSTSVF